MDANLNDTEAVADAAWVCGDKLIDKPDIVSIKVL